MSMAVMLNSWWGSKDTFIKCDEKRTFPSKIGSIWPVLLWKI